MQNYYLRLIYTCNRKNTACKRAVEISPILRLPVRTNRGLNISGDLRWPRSRCGFLESEQQTRRDLSEKTGAEDTERFHNVFMIFVSTLRCFASLCILTCSYVGSA